MPGTKAGGLKAAATNKKKYGEGFYSRIGKKGGYNGTTGGFGSDKVGKDGLTGAERARIAGAKGGKKSRRGPAKKKNDTSLQVGYLVKKYGKAKRIVEDGVINVRSLQ